MKNIILAALLATVPVTSAVITNKTNENKRRRKLDDVCEQLIDEGVPTTVAIGPHVKAGEAVEWFIYNTNKIDGWGFTGYADLKIDKDNNRSRWKFGMINGELDWSTYNQLNRRREPNYQLLEEWNQRMTQEPVFGICFTKEF